jgi:hypothetical protein
MIDDLRIRTAPWRDVTALGQPQHQVNHSTLVWPTSLRAASKKATHVFQRLFLGVPTMVVPTMLTFEERQLLYWLGSRWFRNEGVLVDAGCFLGGSTMALAEGVKANPQWRARPRNKVIHSYDLFQVEEWTVGIYFPKGTAPKSSFEARFRNNIASVSDLVEVHAGDVTAGLVPTEPIEVLFIDLAKHWTVSDYVTYHFFARLRPGTSVVVQQDYLYTSWNWWLHATMEFYADYFEIVGDTGINSVVFLYKTEIPAAKLKHNLIASMTRSELNSLIDRAIGRFEGAQRNILLQSKAQFESMMNEVGWRD